LPQHELYQAKFGAHHCANRRAQRQLRHGGRASTRQAFDWRRRTRHDLSGVGGHGPFGAAKCRVLGFTGFLEQCFSPLLSAAPARVAACELKPASRTDSDALITTPVVPSNATSLGRRRSSGPVGASPETAAARLMNSVRERFLGSVRRNCLDRNVILGGRHIEHALKEYCFDYFNVARPHEGIGPRLPTEPAFTASAEPAS
jgi:hypothetical protein